MSTQGLQRSLRGTTMQIGDSAGFLPANQARTIDVATPLGEVLEKIEGHTSGFVLSKSGKSQGYVSASQIISNLVDTGSWKGLGQQAIIDLVRNPGVNLSMVPVSNQPVASEADSATLKAYSDLVVQVMKGGKLTGFVLPNELTSDIHTTPRVYHCKNPKSPHPNSRPGPYCRICPYAVPE
jgi:hypothetical protein